MKVIVAPDFEHLLPALADTELAQLEQNCLDDPKHENMPPVILWANHKNTIVDGHNQNRIRSKHNLKIKYVRRDFESRDDAKRFALDVQFGRRNLSASQRAMAYAELPHRPEGRPKGNCAILPSIPKLAENAGVSVRTMKDATKVAKQGSEETKAKVRDGNLPVSKAVKGPEFDTAKLDKQPERKSPKPKNARPVVSTKQRKDCLALHAKLCRALSAIGIYDEFIVPLSQIIERLKQI